MSEIMAVLLNGVAQVEYDRSKPMPAYQGAYLDKMDSKMSADGVQIGEQTITNPDASQRAQFVAANLAHAVVTGEEATTAALCTYLANRIPELKQVRIDHVDGQFTIEFVFDEDYKKQVEVSFNPIH